MMPSESSVADALDVAFLVAVALESVGATYFVGGSVASSLQGEPRATNDIDFVVALDPARVGAFATALGDDFEVDQEMLREALSHGSTANFFYLPFVTKIASSAWAGRLSTKQSSPGANASPPDPGRSSS